MIEGEEENPVIITQSQNQIQWETSEECQLMYLYQSDV